MHRPHAWFVDSCVLLVVPMMLSAFAFACARTGLLDDEVTPTSRVPSKVDAGGGAAPIATAEQSPSQSCRSRPWAEPRRVDGINTAVEDGSPTLTADELTIVFHSQRAFDGGTRYELWTSTRPTRTDAFPAPVRVSEVSSDVDDAYPTFTSDGVTLLFASRRLDPAGPFRLFRAERPELNVGFSRATALEPSGADRAAGWPAAEDAALYPSLTPDRTLLYFAATRGADAFYRIYRSESVEAGGFTEPVREDAVDDSKSSLAFILSHDRSSLFVSRREAGGPYQIHSAVRSSDAEPFGALAPVDALNANALDTRAGWLSPDSCRLYLARRSDPATDFDIYVADRLP